MRIALCEIYPGGPAMQTKPVSNGPHTESRLAHYAGVSIDRRGRGLARLGLAPSRARFPSRSGLWWSSGAAVRPDPLGTAVAGLPRDPASRRAAQAKATFASRDQSHAAGSASA